MSSGKELARMVDCGYWKQHIKSRKDFCSVQIFDTNGKPITSKQAKEKYFCHARILFKSDNMGEIKLLGVILKMIADTSSESMGMNINENYGFQEVIIS